VNSLPKSVTRQRRGCDVKPDPSAPESSTANHSATEPPTISVVIRPNRLAQIPAIATDVVT